MYRETHDGELRRQLRAMQLRPRPLRMEPLGSALAAGILACACSDTGASNGAEDPGNHGGSAGNGAGAASVAGASTAGGASGGTGGSGASGPGGFAGSAAGGAGSSGAAGMGGTGGSNPSQVCSNYCELWFLDLCNELLDTYESLVDCIPACETFTEAQQRCRASELFTVYLGTSDDRDPHCWYAVGERDAPTECM